VRQHDNVTAAIGRFRQDPGEVPGGLVPQCIELQQQSLPGFRVAKGDILGGSAPIPRVLCVWETMCAVLDSLAIVAPGWLRDQSQPEWVERYGPRSEESRVPVGEEARLAFAEEIGQQGRALLDALFDPTAPEWLRQVPAVDILRRVWVQNYQRIENVLQWRRSREYCSLLSFYQLSL